MAGACAAISCGHVADCAIACVECSASACLQCATRGRELALIGEGPLRLGLRGPVELPGIDPYTFCGGCNVWHCSGCAGEVDLCTVCKGVVCSSCERMDCDTCGSTNTHADCMDERLGCMCDGYNRVCGDCPCNEDEGFKAYSCAWRETLKGSCQWGARDCKWRCCSLCVSEEDLTASCYICDSWYCGNHDDELKRCRCKELVCLQCFSVCFACGCRSCAEDCTNECRICHKRFCGDNCGNACETCAVFVCTGCDPACDCGAYYCSKCEHYSDCILCGYLLCEACENSCSRCQKKVCDAHFSEELCDECRPQAKRKRVDSQEEAAMPEGAAEKRAK